MSVVAEWRRAQRAMYQAFVAASIGAGVDEVAPGVFSAITPSAPSRSLLNAVIVEDAHALTGSIDALRARYAQAGINAWMVWVAPGEEALAQACLAAGATRDGQPPLMRGDLMTMDLEPRVDVELLAGAPFSALCEINDAAYGLPAGVGFHATFDGEPAAPVRWAVGLHDGVPSACAACLVLDGDAYIIFVAVRPEARGRGLAGEIVRGLLRAARDQQGARTTTLESSAMGFAVYERMGYGSLGACGMWEWRTPHPV